MKPARSYIEVDHGKRRKWRVERPEPLRFGRIYAQWVREGRPTETVEFTVSKIDKTAIYRQCE